VGWGPERLNSTQRIRIGLSGLAFVFLFVLLFAAITRSSNDDGANVAAVNSAEPNEPLAELGVAPGQSEADNLADNEADAERNRMQ
jgi:hypothetical protein